MSFWDLARADASAVCNDVNGPQWSAVYTPPNGAPLAITCMAEERNQVIRSGEGGNVMAQRFLAVGIPFDQVAPVLRGATITIASGPFQAVWTVQVPESRTQAMTVVICKYERPLAISGDGARKLDG